MNGVATMNPGLVAGHAAEHQGGVRREARLRKTRWDDEQ